MDPYRRLGVRPGASAEEVRRAFNREAMLHHPDRHQGDTTAEERFKEILESYQMASRSVEQRARQPSPQVDPAKARATKHRGISSKRYVGHLRKAATHFLKIASVFVVSSFITILIVLTYIWLTTKTDWIPG